MPYEIGTGLTAIREIVEAKKKAEKEWREATEDLPAQWAKGRLHAYEDALRKITVSFFRILRDGCMFPDNHPNNGACAECEKECAGKAIPTEAQMAELLRERDA